MLESLVNKVDSKDTKEAPAEVFSCEYCKVFKNTFFTKNRIFPGKHHLKTAFPYRYFLELATLEYGCLMKVNIKKLTRQRQATLMSNQCLIPHY